MKNPALTFRIAAAAFMLSSSLASHSPLPPPPLLLLLPSSQSKRIHTLLRRFTHKGSRPLAMAACTEESLDKLWRGVIRRGAVFDQVRADENSLVVVSFYQFARISNYMAMREHLAHVCHLNRVSGGIILAPEGVNGSICGTQTSVRKVLETIQVDMGLANLRLTESSAGLDAEMLPDGYNSKSPLGAGENAPFRWGHVRVKVKEEVVPLGVKGIDPSKQVGKYVKPNDWNTLISDPETLSVRCHGDVDCDQEKTQQSANREKRLMLMILQMSYL